MPFFKSKQCYGVLDEKDPDSRIMLQNDEEYVPGISIRIGTRSVIVLGVMALLYIISSWVVFIGNVLQKPAPPISVVASIATPKQTFGMLCQTPAVRREWRTLSVPQKQDYISAVQCLSTRPSKLQPEGTLYDDFPWAHKHLADNAHVGASFLPWHRYFTYIYEKALKEECGLQGALPYWDWSQDWEAPDASPVWDEEFGIGGDGEAGGAETVGNGRCVTRGPFAHANAMYYDGEKRPHCLSRGFPAPEELRKLGELIQPSVIESLMREDKYSAFEAELEKRAHHFLTHSVRGDLSRFTGPYDPVFFLHHANLDRLWWQWQQVGSERQFAYDGKASNVTESEARLDDIMEFAGLAGNQVVGSVMETNAGPFCYTY